MVDEISGRNPNEPSEPLVWKPWQPPVVPTVAAPAAPAAGPVQPAVGPIASDRNAAGAWRAEAMWASAAGEIDLNALDVPDVGASTRGAALAELGVVSAVSQVALAFSRTTFDPGAIAQSLGQFAERLGAVTQELLALPGVGDALAVFGGVGAIVAGATGLQAELTAATENRQVGSALGLAANAAQLVGGVAMALGAFCPPLGALGAAVVTAGTALKLGQLGVENRDGMVKAGKAVSDGLGQAADQAAKILSNNGGSITLARADGPWQWMTGQSV